TLHQVDQLLGQIDVGVFQGSGIDAAPLSDPGLTLERCTGFIRGHPGSTADRTQAFRVGEVGEQQLALNIALAVAVVGDDLTLGIHGDAHEGTGGKAVRHVLGHVELDAVLGATDIVHRDVQRFHASHGEVEGHSGSCTPNIVQLTGGGELHYR